MPHVVLLGDSIFDNAAYVPGGPAVIDQLRRTLPGEWSATLLAVDGDVTADVQGQLDGLPKGATHLVVSCGGNDALGYLPLLSESAQSYSQVLVRFAEIRAEFCEQYRKMLQQVSETNLDVTICTVYDCVPGLGGDAHSALSMFNEVILREAVGAKVPVIDLRLVCSDKSDYSEISPIEPSAQGGQKIVNVIRNAIDAGVSPRQAVSIHT